jgi:hypothetical protein
LNVWGTANGGTAPYHLTDVLWIGETERCQATECCQADQEL